MCRQSAVSILIDNWAFSIDTCFEFWISEIRWNGPYSWFRTEWERKRYVWWVDMLESRASIHEEDTVLSV